MYDQKKVQSVLHKVSSGLAVASSVVGAVIVAVQSVPAPVGPMGWMLFVTGIASALGFGHDALKK
jgi:hypothetical protein